MITSLLSAYIAFNIDPQMHNFESSIYSQSNPTILASSNIANIIENSHKPVKDPHQIAPIIDSKGAVAIDRKTGTILYEKNPHQQMAIASITKLMTALIIIEENQLDEIVTVSRNSSSTEGSTMFLHSGEQITVENLIRGLIINSANDSAVALAEHNAGSVQDFVDKMNKRAAELGLSNTHFANPTGLDDSNNYSSPYDIAKLGNYLYNNKLIQQAAQTQSESVPSKDNQFIHELQTTNKLIGNYPGIKGLKTGHTDLAGLCLISVAENDEGDEIITVVLNSPARFKETKILSDWVFRSYNW